MLVPIGDEAFDLAAQVGDRGEGAAADRALSNQAEPALDLVQPGGIGGCVMQVKTRATREPGFDFGVFVRAVVIDDQMYVQFLGHFALDVTHEGEELPVSMTRLTLREYLAIGDIQRCKQGGRTVTVTGVLCCMHCETYRSSGKPFIRSGHYCSYLTPPRSADAHAARLCTRHGPPSRSINLR